MKSTRSAGTLVRPGPGGEPSLPHSEYELTGTVFNIMRFCQHDGPGIRTVVFLKGCPLRCKWCHNPEGLDRHSEIAFIEARCIRCGECFVACPEGAVERVGETFRIVDDLCAGCGTCVETCYSDARQLVGKEMTMSDVIEEVEKDRVYYDESGGGVTFSGGEPLFQHRFLSSVLKEVRRQGIHSAIETSGYTSPEILDEISGTTDLFLYDVKLMDDRRHKELTGVSNVLILENLKRLSRRGVPTTVRVPVIPGVNDDEKDIRELAGFLAAETLVSEVHLLPFHEIGMDKYQRLRKQYPFIGNKKDKADLDRLAGILEDGGIHAVIGG